MSATKALIEFEEQHVLDLQVPPFKICESTLTIVELPGGSRFAGYENAIAAMLSNETTTTSVIVRAPLRMVSDYRDSWLRRALRPLCVHDYLGRFMNPEARMELPFFEDFQINPGHRMRDLTAPQLRLLALCVTRSWSPHLMFDLRGIHPIGGSQLFGVAKRLAKAGAAILMFDNNPEFEADCDQYVRSKILGANARCPEFKG